MTDMPRDIIEDQELFAIFLQEASEQIDTLDTGLVRLEHEPDNTELIQGIFRAAHTLKGSSGAMGLRQMADLTHAMEDVLDRIRQGAVTVSAELMDALLAGLDQLRNMEHALETGQRERLDAEDTTDIVNVLHMLASPAAATDTAAKSSQLTPLTDDEVGLLLNIAADCPMPNIRAYMVLEAWKQFGDVTQCIPTQEQLDEETCGHRLLVALRTEATEDDLRAAALRIAEVEWVRAARGAAAAGMRLDMPERNRESERPVPATDTEHPTPSGATTVQQTVRVNVETLDEIMNLVGEMVLDRTRVAQLAEAAREQLLQDDLAQDLDAVSVHLGKIVGELHERVLQTRMLPISQLFNRFPRLVRDLCRTLGKEADFIVDGENEQLDRSVIEKLVDPLTHILRNAVDHGMESPDARIAQGKPARGTITLSAARAENQILICVSDDGPGINTERLKEKALTSGLITSEQAAMMPQRDVLGLIFASGLSTAEKVSDVSGRGVGMDVVKRNVELLGGAIQIESDLGQGSTITLKIPLTLAIVRALIVRVGQVAIAIPLALVEETLEMPFQTICTVHGRGLLRWRDMVVPVIRLSEALPGCGTSEPRPTLQLVTVNAANHVVSLIVDEILGHQEIVVKSLGSYLGDIPGLAGATILGNGNVALIADIGKLSESGLLQHAATSGIMQAA